MHAVGLKSCLQPSNDRIQCFQMSTTLQKRHLLSSVICRFVMSRDHENVDNRVKMLSFRGLFPTCDRDLWPRPSNVMQIGSIIKMNQNAKHLGQRSFLSKVIVRTQTHTHAADWSHYRDQKSGVFPKRGVPLCRKSAQPKPILFREVVGAYEYLCRARAVHDVITSTYSLLRRS